MIQESLAPLADVLYNVMATVALDSALFCAALAPDCEASPKRSNVPSMSRGGGSGVSILALCEAKCIDGG